MFSRIFWFCNRVFMLLRLCLVLRSMHGDTCPTEWYMSNDHSVNNKFWLIESWFLDTRSCGSRYNRTVKLFTTNQTLGHILYPGFWLVENRSTMRCICCRWTLYPKINFQYFLNARTISQNDRWTCITIALHSVLSLYKPSDVLFTFCGFSF